MNPPITPEQQEQLSMAHYALEVAGVNLTQLVDAMIENPGQVALDVNESGDFRLFDPFQLVKYDAPRDANGWTAFALSGE